MHLGVFLVDDEEDIRLLIRTLIESANEGLEVLGEAGDGQTALERIDEMDPQVVVLDQRMPGLSGLETAGQILNHRPGQRIILCSAYLDEDLRQKADRAGITLCLTKHQVGEIPATLKSFMAP